MNDNSLQLSDNPHGLTEYKMGVEFVVSTMKGDEYRITIDRANKLAALLTSPDSIRFVQLTTATGTVLLNVSTITQIAPDPDRAHEVIRQIRFYRCDKELYERQPNRPPITDDEWEYFLPIAQTDKEVPNGPNTIQF